MLQAPGLVHGRGGSIMIWLGVEIGAFLVIGGYLVNVLIYCATSDDRGHIPGLAEHIRDFTGK
jgi:hypothetical protein